MNEAYAGWHALPWTAGEPSALPWLPASGDLLDINVWLALAVQEHPHHEAARRYWAEVQARAGAGLPGAPSLWFCRVSMLGLVRLLCQPKVVGEGALTLPSAFALYRQFRAVPQVGLLAEPPGCDERLQALVTAGTLPTRLWTDAYFAALAQASALRLVTFDQDFRRFGLERCLVLAH
jgi:hypothetical protein